MAHECSECGRRCHCNGDIDDIHWGTDHICDCAYSEWGCGREMDDEEDEDDEYWLEQTRPKD